MSETNRSARSGVKGEDSAPTEQLPKVNGESSREVSARKPVKGAYEPAPSAQNGQNGQNGRSPASAKPAARKPMRGGLSAEEYARTTGPSADSTAVIPVVKDEPNEAATVEEPPAPAKKQRKSRVSFITDGAKGKSEVPAAEAAAPKEPAPDKPGAVVVAPASVADRQASLRLASVDPWSVTRLAFVVSVALMIVAVVAAIVFWVVLAITGVWDNINDSVKNVLSDDSGGFNIGNYLGFWRLIGFALMASSLNVVFMTALATISAHLYNLAASIMGGFKVNFTEEK